MSNPNPVEGALSLEQVKQIVDDECIAAQWGAPLTKATTIGVLNNCLRELRDSILAALSAAAAPTCNSCQHEETLHRAERGGYCIHAGCSCKQFVAAAPARDGVREGLEWALRQIRPPYRMKGQNEDYCDAYERARNALTAAKEQADGQ